MSAHIKNTLALYGHFCNVKGCNTPRPKNNHNGLCNKHNHIFRRYGDPLQVKIKLVAFRACEKKTKAWITRAKREPQWDAMFMDPLRRNLETGADDIRFDLNLYLNGKAMRNGIRDALRILDAWHSNYTPEERLNFWLAIQYFYIHYPKSFSSFEGYKAQLVQLLYRESGIKIGKQRHNAEPYRGKTTKHDTPPVPRYMYEFIWEHMFGIFGAVAYHMNRLYNIEERRQKYQESMNAFFSQATPPKIKARKKDESTKSTQG